MTHTREVTRLKRVDDATVPSTRSVRFARDVVEGPAGTDRGRNWFAFCALAMLVASDYKFRVRPPGDTLGGGIDIAIVLEIASYCVVAGYLLLTKFSTQRMTRLPALLYFTIAYVLLILFSLVEAPYPSLAGVRAAEVVVLLGLTLAAFRHATSADMHRFAHGFLMLVAVSVIAGVLVRMPRFPQQESRFTWLRIHPVTAGVFVGIATVIALTYLVTWSANRDGPRWPRYSYAALLAIVGGGLVATQTRGAVLGAAVGAVVVGWCVVRGTRKLELFAAVAVVGLAGLLTWGNVVADYLARGETTAELATLNSRTELWSLAWEAIKVHPLFGWGLGSSRGIFLEEIGLGGGHNALVNVAVDLGIFGALVWLALMATLIRSALTIPRSPTGRVLVDRVLVLGILAFLITNSAFFEGLGAVANVSGTWLFLCIAWVLVIKRNDYPARVRR